MPQILLTCTINQIKIIDMLVVHALSLFNSFIHEKKVEFSN